jgi:hypothetical protein
LEKFTETEYTALTAGVRRLTRTNMLSVEENDAILTKLTPNSDEDIPKFTEMEYAALADGINALARRGELTIADYHSLLIKLASNRESEDSKPEVLISNVRYETYGSDAEIARGYALNHPRLGATSVRTSLIVSKAADGSSFETLNTRYIIVPNIQGDEKSAVDTSGPDIAATVTVLSQKIPLSKLV